MSTLDDLIAAVEAGQLPEAVFHGLSSIRGHWAYTTGLDAEQRRWAYHSYNGSLDAAKVLHEALLPGWEYNVTSAFCLVYPIAAPEDEGIISGYADNPARSWLLAILRAYRSLQK